MYEFYIDGVRLPVTPGKLQVKIGNQNKTANLINEGEINILKTPGLTELAFDALLPNVSYPFARGSSQSYTYIDRFVRLKTGLRRFRFIVARIMPSGRLDDTNLLVSLEDLTDKEDAAASGLDRLVTFKLKQYRPYGTKTAVLKNAAGSVKAAYYSSAKRDTRQPAGSHTVVKGDTLWDICKKQLGDGSRYPEIAKLNGISNPNLIFPGQVIKLG